MAGNEDEATPPPRRRRRAVRRAAGPPGPHLTGSPQGGPEHTGSRQGEPELDGAQDEQARDLLPPAAPDDDGTLLAAAPLDQQRAAPGQPHPHVPGPGHGGHHPARESASHHGVGAGETPRRNGRSAREDAAERSLRSLVTTRSSQVSPVAAMRAREVALPSEADLAAAEAEVTIVRRHYMPPTALTAGRRPDRSRRRPGDIGQ